ncbi:bromodomain-containing protein DDB_G0280777-like isoform X2 [Drosophila navojoa]|uniref:bromodomain-containing protein DDB_G0280777-like isoform X2 n=1 Tax=Drosophila navojoa TaxID=7232 RepID=UPI0011BEAF53|nr:bromodomain-containing protein DDB_G0280777-like isoform X2 [Drosophila navojoa]
MQPKRNWKSRRKQQKRLRKHKAVQKQVTSPEIQLPKKKELLPEIQQPGNLVLSPVIQRLENLAPEIRQTGKLVVRAEIQQPGNLVQILELGNLELIQQPGNLVQILERASLEPIQQPESLEQIQQPGNLEQIQQPEKLVLEPQMPESPEIQQLKKLELRLEIQQPENLEQIQQPGNLEQIQQPEKLVLEPQKPESPEIQQLENLVQRLATQQVENLVLENLVVLGMDNKAQRVGPETINKELVEPLKDKRGALVPLEEARSPPGKRAKEKRVQNWTIPLKSSSTNLLRTQRKRYQPVKSMALAWKGSYAKFWICLLMSVDFVSANAIFRKAAFMLYAISSTTMGCTRWILRTWPICTSVSLLRQKTFCLDACLI